MRQLPAFTVASALMFPASAVAEQPWIGLLDPTESAVTAAPVQAGPGIEYRHNLGNGFSVGINLRATLGDQPELASSPTRARNLAADTAGSSDNAYLRATIGVQFGLKF